VSAPAQVSAWDRMVWPEGELEAWLAGGAHRRELTAWFGEAEYGLLQRLALTAAAVEQDPQRCVYYVPGLMGSQLSLPRARPLPDNLLWLDPGDVQQGNLSLLAVPGAKLAVAGPVTYGYLPLKFALQSAGYTVRCFAYDWRLGLAESGVALAAQLGAEAAGEIHIVAHSMGGLVARSALRSEAGRRVRRLVTLGTPHGGSFAPVQAVRGTYPLLRRLAQIDARHDAETLAREVFSGFHSLYQMLPRDHVPDLVDQRNWPVAGPQPNATLLQRARLLDLGGADRRIAAIAGHGFQTVDDVTQAGGEFHYRYSYAGDGTVPLARAVLSGCPAWYCNVTHGELTRSAAVHAAVVALLAGDTPQLTATAPLQSARPAGASDTGLREMFAAKLDWTRLDSQQRRAYMDSLNRAPPAAPAL